MQNMQTTKDYRNASPMKPVQSFDRDCAEKTLREAMTMSIFCHAHPLTSLRNILRKQNVVTSSNLRRTLSGSTVRVSGMLILVHTPPTKSGKRVMFLTLEDEMGLFEVVVFSKAQDRFAKLILTSEVLTLEGRLQRQGPTGLAISIVMEKALVGLCGPLTKLLGYVMKIPKTKTYSKSPTASNVIPESEVSEYPTQLVLGF
jgi:DNA polymerase III alpha subunit